jgi:hypothetical protein
MQTSVKHIGGWSLYQKLTEHRLCAKCLWRYCAERVHPLNSGIQNYKKFDKLTHFFRALLTKRLKLTLLIRTGNKQVTSAAKKRRLHVWQTRGTLRKERVRKAKPLTCPPTTRFYEVFRGQVLQKYPVLAANSPPNRGSAQVLRKYPVLAANSPPNRGSAQVLRKYPVQAGDSPPNRGSAHSLLTATVCIRWNKAAISDCPYSPDLNSSYCFRQWNHS